MAYYQRDMLSISTRNILARTLADAIVSAASLEPFRQHLASIPHFDCLSLFRYLDQGKKGYLNYSDLRYCLGNIDERYLQYAFSRIDSLKVGEIDRMQFANFLLPRENSQLQELVSQRIGQPQSGQLPQTIREQTNIFSKLIKEIIIDEIANLAPLRKSLLNSDDYTVKGAMNALDVDRHDFISAEDIYKFVNGQGIEIQKTQADSFIQLYDSNLDGKLDINDLQWAIEGLESDSSWRYVEKLSKKESLPLNNNQKTIQNKENQENKHSKKSKEAKETKEKSKLNKNQDQSTQIKTIMPQQYLQSLKIYQQCQKTALMIEQKLLKQQAEINQQINRKKEEILRQLHLQRQRQRIQIQVRLQQERVALQQQQIQDKIQAQRETLQRLQEEQIRKVSQEKYAREAAYQKTIRARELEEIQRRCSYEAERAIQKHIIRAAVSHRDTNRVGQLYHLPIASQYPIRQISFSHDYNYKDVRADLREHLQTTDIHLQRSKQLRQMIQKQRQKERQIHNHFISLYNLDQKDAYSDQTRIVHDYSSPQKDDIKNSKYVPSTGKFITTQRK